METLVKKPITYCLSLFYPMFKKWIPQQVYAYLAVGALNTLLNIALFALFFQVILPLDGFYIGRIQIASYTAALLIAFLLTVPTGFWLSKTFAFANSQKENAIGSNRQQIRYMLVVLQGLLSDYLILTLLVMFAGIHPTIAKVLSTSIVLTFNYLLQKYFTFKSNNNN